MAEYANRGVFFNNVGDDIRQYNAEDLSTAFDSGFGTGVCGTGDLKVNFTAGTVAIGACFIKGRYKQFIADTPFSVSAGTMGYVVAEMVDTTDEREIRIKVIAQSGTMPVLVQNNTLYQMPLARFDANSAGAVTSTDMRTEASGNRGAFCRFKVASMFVGNNLELWRLSGGDDFSTNNNSVFELYGNLIRLKKKGVYTIIPSLSGISLPTTVERLPTRTSLCVVTNGIPNFFLNTYRPILYSESIPAEYRETSYDLPASNIYIGEDQAAAMQNTSCGIAYGWISLQTIPNDYYLRWSEVSNVPGSYNVSTIQYLGDI